MKGKCFAFPSKDGLNVCYLAASGGFSPTGEIPLYRGDFSYYTGNFPCQGEIPLLVGNYLHVGVNPLGKGDFPHYKVILHTLR